jgi:hypothetical protein
MREESVGLSKQQQISCIGIIITYCIYISILLSGRDEQMEGAPSNKNCLTGE